MVAVTHVEVAGHEGELDKLLVGEMFLHLGGDVVAVFGCVEGDVFGP